MSQTWPGSPKTSHFTSAGHLGSYPLITKHCLLTYTKHSQQCPCKYRCPCPPFSARGRPRGKKENPLFSGARKKVSLTLIAENLEKSSRFMSGEVFSSIEGSFPFFSLNQECKKTGHLANRVFACVTPAIFVVFRGLRSKALVFLWIECRFVIFAVFVKTPCFR